MTGAFSLRRSQLASALTGWLDLLLPAPLKRFLQREEACITICVAADGFTASLVPSSPKQGAAADWRDETGRWSPDSAFRRLARIGRDRPIEFELPPDLVLSQAVKLPRIALANLPDAIAYGLPAWSPFEAGEVYVTGSVERVEAEQALIRIDYTLRSKADPLLARLAGTGLAVDRLVFDRAAKRSVSLPTPKLARLKTVRQTDGALAGLAVVLALALGVVYATTLSRRLERLDAEIRSELALLREDELLRTAHDALAARRVAVARRRAREITASELLASLSGELPDGILVQAVEMADGRGRVELSGADPGEILQALRGIQTIDSPALEPRRGSRLIGVTFQLARKIR